MGTKRLLAISCTAFILCFYNAALAETNFPSIDKIDIGYYTTEVQITVTGQKASAYATEYHSLIDDSGVVKLYFEGDVRQIYYDNSTYQITEVNGDNCTVTDADISEYDYYPIYYGWLNKDPLVIGPSAPLWYAQDRRDKIVDAEPEEVRNIMCDKFVLPIVNKRENITITYYFAPKDWTTPYQAQKLRVPIRIRVSGLSSRYSADDNTFSEVDEINDFAYYKPTVDDRDYLLPPTGLGCDCKKKTKNMPPIPDVFQYSAEVVDLLQIEKHDDVEIQFQKVWFDYRAKLARLDKYSRKKGYKSSFFDFNSGTAYRIQNDGSCRMTTVRGSEFEILDYGMTFRMMEANEALNLKGEFYEMGTRMIRGLICDIYESVTLNKFFIDKTYYKLVVTAYFTGSDTYVEINGEMESRVPMYFLISGWDSPSNKTLQLQYNVFGFNDVIWPEMYSSFKLERCYTKAETKAYFVILVEAPAKVAAQMEENDELIMRELRNTISKHAKVPEHRIPYLKADYKPTGVYVTGVLLERPPAMLQFYEFDSSPTVSNDPFLKPIVDAKDKEQCAYACVDEGDFLCKGFFYCGQACFLKSNDPFDKEQDGTDQDLGFCTEYLRVEIDSTNFRQAYLVNALENLETAVLNGSIAVEFQIPNGEEKVIFQDIVVGDGPYTGVDAGDKPFQISVELRKLDASFETTRTVDYAETLHECYKRCKEAGSLCSSFSFCPDTTKDNKECMITSELIVKGLVKDNELVPDKNCNVYNLKFLEYFTAYPERVSLLPGDKVIRSTESVESCAMICRLEDDFQCRGFEYCRAARVCTLHKKHILDLKPGESGTATSRTCVHYAARYIADYMDLAGILVDDNSNVRYETTLEECAKICSVELKDKCKSFNYCPGEDASQSTCALSSKLLIDDGVTTTENFKCSHYEKRDKVQDWSNAKAKNLSTGGYTKKGFTGLVIGMLALGLIIGAFAFVLYSYMKSKSSGDGMAVRFMKNDS